MRTVALLVAVMSAEAPSAAAGQSAAAQKARCTQLIDFYDRYGSGRSQNSDGRRNHTRIGAEIDCQRGRYAQGIAAMESLLRAKKFDIPPPGQSIPEDDD
ncbi:MAG: hypothetical protein ACOY4R_02155 [Pseudomonadota bacterium]